MLAMYEVLAMASSKWHWWNKENQFYLIKHLTSKPTLFVSRLEIFVQGMQIRLGMTLLPQCIAVIVTWHSDPASFYSKYWVNLTVPCTNISTLLMIQPYFFVLICLTLRAALLPFIRKSYSTSSHQQFWGYLHSPVYQVTLLWNSTCTWRESLK